MYLHKSLFSFSVSDAFIRRTLVVCLCWIAGLFGGILMAVKADDSFLSLMRLSAKAQVSIVSLLPGSLLPFLIAAYAVNIHQFWILYSAAGLKAFCFSVCACLLVRSFGSAGWLVQPMFQFCGTVTAVVFCWYCIRLTRIGLKARDLIGCILLCSAVAVFDYLVVSPFLAILLQS